MMFALTVATLVTPLLAHNSLRKNCRSPEPKKFDAFGNPLGANHDYGGSDFNANGQKILIIDLLNKYLEDDDSNPISTYNLAVKELTNKGFNVTISEPEKGTMRALLNDNYKQLWIIDGNYRDITLTDNDIQAIKEKYNEGLSVFLLADNEPYSHTVNILTKELIDESIQVSGNHFGDHVVHEYNPNGLAGGFVQDDVTRGIASLFTGFTVADIQRSSKQLTGTFTPLIYDYDWPNNSFLVAAKYEEEGNPSKKRIIIDGAFTRILDNRYQQTPGTARYIKNSAVWLSKLVH